MKKITILLILSAFSFVCAAGTKTTPVTEYRIIYSVMAEPEEGTEMAASLNAMILRAFGVELTVCPDTDAEYKHEIILGRTSRPRSMELSSLLRDTFDYIVEKVDGSVCICGGGCWAMEYAMGKWIESRKKFEEGFYIEGSIRNRFIFPMEEGTNLRILDDNIWQYDKDVNAPAWSKIEEDCTDPVRAKGFQEIVAAFSPDIFTMQEYSNHMDRYLGRALAKMGYAISYHSLVGAWNHTPIFYKKKTVGLVETLFHSYTPEEFNNHGTKSFNSAVFIHKKTGRKFAVINTHLWWQSDRRKAGSTAARADQVRKMMEEGDRICAAHDCTLFVMGDMNCELRTEPMQLFLNAGYVPVWRAATVFGDGRNGHHECSAKGFSRKSNRKGGDTDGQAAIDQFFIYNAKEGAEVKVFRRVQAYFTILLTDHYPNYLDARL